MSMRTTVRACTLAAGLLAAAAIQGSVAGNAAPAGCTGQEAPSLDAAQTAFDQRQFTCASAIAGAAATAAQSPDGAVPALVLEAKAERYAGHGRAALDILRRASQAADAAFGATSPRAIAVRLDLVALLADVATADESDDLLSAVLLPLHDGAPSSNEMQRLAGRAMRLKARNLARRHDFKGALSVLDQATGYYRMAGDQEGLALVDNDVVDSLPDGGRDGIDVNTLKAVQIADRAVAYLDDPAHHPGLEAALAQERKAWVLWMGGKSADAAAALERAQQIRRQVLGAAAPDNPDYAEGLLIGGVFAMHAGDQAKSEALYRQALAIYRASYGEASYWTAVTETNLGQNLVSGQARRPTAAQYAEAEDLFKAASATMLHVAGPLRQIWPEGDLAGAYDDEGKYELAAKSYGLVLDVQKAQHGPGAVDGDLAMAYANYGSVLYKSGRYAEAADALDAALAIRQELFGENDRDTATTHGMLMLTYQKLGRTQDAWKEADALLVYDGKSNTTDTAIDLINVASLFYETGKLEVSRETYSRAVAMLKHISNDAEALSKALSGLSVVELAMKSVSFAVDDAHDAVAAAQELGPDHPALASALRSYASALRAAGRTAEAEAADAQAQEIETSQPH